MDGERERGRAVGVAIGGAGGGVANRAAGADDALHAAEIIADDGGGGQRDSAGLQRLLESLEQLALAVTGEGDAFQPSVIERGGEMLTHRPADARRIDGGEGGGHDAREQNRFLLRERHAVEHQYLARDERAAVDTLERPRDGEIALPADVDADEQDGARPEIGRELVRRSVERGVGAFARLHHVGGEDLRGMLHELALELLCPAIGIGEVGAELVDVQGEALRDRIVNGGLVPGESRGVLPEIEIFIVPPGGRGDDAEFEGAAQRIGDDRINRAPDLLGVFVKRELIEDEIGGVSACRGRIRGECEDPRAVRKAKLRFLDFGSVFAAGRVADGVAEDGRGAVDLIHELEGLPLARAEDHPITAGLDGIGDNLEGRCERAADLARFEPNLEARGVLHPGALVGQK